MKLIAAIWRSPWRHPRSIGRAPLLALALLLPIESALPWTAPPAIQFVKLVPTGRPNAVATDSKGNIYIGGESGPSWLAKYDPDGHLLWSHDNPPNPGISFDRPSASVSGMFVDAEDHIQICGSVLGTVLPFGLLPNQRREAGFLARFTPQGSLVSVRFLQNLGFRGANATGVGNRLVPAPDGGAFMAGTAYDLSGTPVAVIGAPVLSMSGYDGYVFKLRSDGSLAWHRRLAGIQSDVLSTMAVARDGSVALAGVTLSERAGIAGVSTSNMVRGINPFLFKLSQVGVGEWSKSSPYFQGTTSILSGIACGVAYSARANAWFWVGEFENSLSLGPEPIPSQGGKDGFLAKIAMDGSVAWVRTLGGRRDQRLNSVMVDEAGTVYVTGYTSGEMTIGSHYMKPAGYSSFDSYIRLFVVAFGDDGEPKWGKHLSQGYWPGEGARASLSPDGGLVVASAHWTGDTMEEELLLPDRYRNPFLLKLRPPGSPPRFLGNPESQVAYAGKPFTLTAEIKGDGPSTRRQWWFNGAPLPGETRPTLTVASAAARHAGRYHVVASNDVGSTESATASISYTEATALRFGALPVVALFGPPGLKHRIEYATEIGEGAQWRFAAELTPTNSPAFWIDLAGTPAERRFYRAAQIR